MTLPMTEKQLADRLEKHLIREMKARLINWGRWWFQGNNLEIKRDSGMRNTSSMYHLMQRGRVLQRSGYSDPHRVPVNDVDALELHQRIVALNPNEIGELRRFYADGGASGTAAQGGLRFRVVRKLCFPA